MPTLSQPAWLRRTAIVITLLAMAGCSSDKGPTAAQAGETLKADITRLMKEAQVLDVKVTDPGDRDISCGEGKAKRTFAVTGRDPASERGPDILNNLLIGALSRVAPYDIVEDRADRPLRVANEDRKTVLILDSRSNGQYGVRGETQCLRTS
jgi:hypothetical protein